MSFENLSVAGDAPPLRWNRTAKDEKEQEEAGVAFVGSIASGQEVASRFRSKRSQ